MVRTLALATMGSIISIAAVAASFDGTWSASLASRDPRCPPMTTDVIVSGGTIYRHGQPGGSVSASGAVALSGLNEYGQGSGRGRIAGNRGSGSWRASGRGGSCSGSWSATRR